MPALPVRILIFLIVGWANVYCCCDAPAQTVWPNRGEIKSCCAEKHLPPQPVTDHRMPNGRKCDECPYFAIRQNTLLPDAPHQVIAPPAPCAFVAPIDLTLSSLLLDRGACVDWIDPIKIPTALLDLNTCLLR